MNSIVTKLNQNLGSEQQYSDKDTSLINSIQLQRKFGLPEDYIELSIFDLNNNLLKINYNYTNYKSLLSSPLNSNNLTIDLTVDPIQDSINMGYNYGSTQLEYNIFRKLFGSRPDNKFFIKTISTDRTELRVSNNNISNSDLEIFYNDFIIQFNSESFYKDFYLNFGDDQLLIGVNLILEQDPTQFNLLIKLYEPLPNNFDIKSQFWFIDKLSEPISYQVDFEVPQQDISNKIQLRGPNLDIKINQELNPSIDYINYNSFFSTTSTSSYQQLKSLLDEKSLDINVDYTDYPNFIHFSSAKERLLNFVYKLKLIEGFKSDLNTLGTAVSTPHISSSVSILQNNINNVIEKFDGYEYYLFFSSESYAWPKKNSILPYVNYESTSSIGLTWLGSDNGNSQLYGGQLYSASNYDDNNQDNLIYTVPEYLRIDDKNKGYEVFIHMIGQHFDNIWLYSKGITDLYNASNNLNEGISKDLVSYALKSLGLKLYSNTNVSSDIFSYLIGVTPSGSYQYSTGSESSITNFVTSSQYSLTGAEIDKEIYKRIYHNLPYLLKTKGTERGLRALIACYGIPDTILHINQFGGTDKDSGSYEQYFDRLSYALNTKTGSVYVTTPWAPSVYQSLSSSIGSGSIVPDTIEFRFKTNGIPTSNFYSQSLFQINSGSSTQFGVQLLYPSQSSTGSYNEYGTLKLAISGNQGYVFSQPISLPFFNNDWWNVMIYRETGSLVSSSVSNNNRYWIYAANSIYNGSDGNTIGYIGSSSLFITGSTSSSYNRSWNLFDTSSFIAYLGGQDSNNKIGSGSTRFSGFLQELRYWVVPIPYQNFIAHTLDPLSIEYNNETSSYSKLIFRLPLGTDLNITGSSIAPSVHPSITGSVAGTGSFWMGNTTSSYGDIFSPGVSLYGVAVYGQDVYFGAGTDIVYTGNTEFYYLKSGNLGINKPTNDKIRIINQDIASGSTLSFYTKIEQKPEIELTRDVNILEVAFSPQDQINNDIIHQLGFFNIDEYIGDPRESSSNRYDNLKVLRDFYFQKYIKRYNIFDLVRIIKYYNNSLFKMMKDFVPARTNISTGIVIKPHFLERPKIKRFDPFVSASYNSFSASIHIERFSGSQGGLFINKSSSYTSLCQTTLGSINILKNDNFEFFTGQLSGSKIRVTTQSLQNNPYISSSGSIDLISFAHSNYNILLNNVSQSKLSTRRYKIDYNQNQNTAVNINLIVSQSNIILSDVQDSNYSLIRHINPRYLGSKTVSQLYNIYTIGDQSYGKTAAVDLYTKKFGLFTNISESIFIQNKQVSHLKYLVDESGSLTELNLQNNNWFEVQNIFKAGNSGTIALFDNQKFTDQKTTDGNKTIYNSGYSYSPYLYFSGSDTTSSFQLVPISNSDLFKFNNSSGSYIPVSLSLSDPIFSTLTFNSYIQGVFSFSLSNTIYSTNIAVTIANVNGFDGSDCTGNATSDLLGSSLVIPSGSITNTQSGLSPLDCTNLSYKKVNSIHVSSSTPGGALVNGNTFTVAGSSTIFTVSIDSTSCNTYLC